MSRRLLVLAMSTVLAGGVSASAAHGFVTGWNLFKLAGQGSQCDSSPVDCHDGPSALVSYLSDPTGAAVGGDGSIYVVDNGPDQLRRISPSGAMSTFTTTGTFTPLPDQPGTAFAFADPVDVARTSSGVMYVSNSGDATILRIAPGGTPTVFAGDGTICPASPTPCGDGGDATAAQLSDPEGLALDSAGNLYVADGQANRVRKITVSTGKISTVAGTGTPCDTPNFSTDCGDGGPASAAHLRGPDGVAVTPDGSKVYIADTRDDRIRLVSGGTITTVAGGGSGCGCIDNAAATDSVLDRPEGLTVDGTGNLFIADSNAGAIRQVDTTGDMFTVAGGTNYCALPISCNSGSALEALIGVPVAIMPDGAGNLVYVDADVSAGGGAGGMVVWMVPKQPLGIPGPKGDTGATGAAGANGTGGAQGPAGPQGPKGSDETSPLGSWQCTRRHLGLGKYRTNCYARVFGDDGDQVSGALTRGGRTIARSSATVRNGIARLHFHSKSRLRGAYALRLMLGDEAHVLRVAV